MEETVKYHLEPVAGSVEGKYRAILERGTTMDTDEVFVEIARQLGRVNGEFQLKHDFLAVLEMLVHNTLSDGRTRRIGDYMEARLDISGSFDRPDSDYDKRVHSLRVNFAALKNARNLQRETPPENTLPSPKGRISAVYTEGGEPGILHYGRNIVIEGEEVELSPGGRVELRFRLPSAKSDTILACEIIVNTESKLVCKWPAMEEYNSSVFLAAKTGKVVRVEESHAKRSWHSYGSAHGRHVAVKFEA